MRALWFGIAVALTFLIADAGAACAEVPEQGVQAGGVNAVLIKPKSPRASIILLAGGDGVLGISGSGEITRLQGNQLVRTRQAYAARGFAVLLPDNGFDLSALVANMGQIKRPVAVVRQQPRHPARGARHRRRRASRPPCADIRIFVRRLGRQRQRGQYHWIAGGSAANVDRASSAGRLPLDAARRGRPVHRLGARQGQGRLAVGRRRSGNPCEADAHHGFAGIDGQVVSAVSGFRAVTGGRGARI